MRRVPLHQPFFPRSGPLSSSAAPVQLEFDNSTPISAIVFAEQKPNDEYFETSTETAKNVDRKSTAETVSTRITDTERNETKMKMEIKMKINTDVHAYRFHFVDPSMFTGFSISECYNF